MNRSSRFVVALGAATGMGFAALVVGPGTASAGPEVLVNHTYADAAQAIADEGGTVIIAVRVGGRMVDDECIVTHAWQSPYIRTSGRRFTHAGKEVLLSLNCNGRYATPASPGASLGSPAGRLALAAAQQAAAAERMQLEQASTPDE